jgi:hypothetical protein
MSQNQAHNQIAFFMAENFDSLAVIKTDAGFSVQEVGGFYVKPLKVFPTELKALNWAVKKHLERKTA